MAPLYTTQFFRGSGNLGSTTIWSGDGTHRAVVRTVTAWNTLPLLRVVGGWALTVDAVTIVGVAAGYAVPQKSYTWDMHAVALENQTLGLVVDTTNQQGAWQFTVSGYLLSLP